MMDIVERLQTFLGNGIGEDAAKEIESLRQRVKELQQALLDAADSVIAIGKELAALKKSQGEPVGIVQMVSIVGTPMQDSRGVDWLKSIPAGTKLYTAPTLPEGWQIVPIEPTQEMKESAKQFSWWEQKSMAELVWSSMLAAAPKPEDV